MMVGVVWLGGVGIRVDFRFFFFLGRGVRGNSVG